MDDQSTPAPDEIQDTPQATDEAAEATPSEEPTTTPAESQIDYEQRYNDLRPEYDRSQQFMAALQGRQGPEAQQRAYQELGLELVGDEDTEDDDLPPDPLDEIQELKKWKSEFEKRQEQEHFERLEEQFLEGELEKIAKSEDRDLSDEEVEVIVSYAIANRHDDGRPDVEGGHAKLNAIYSNAQDRLLKPKKNAPKPGKGTAGVEKDDLSTLEGRQKAALAAVAESSSE